MKDLEILGLLIVHLVLIALPGVAAVLLAVRLGARRVPVLLALALATTGAGAMLAFWLYYADPIYGKIWSFVLVFGAIGVIAGSLWRHPLPSDLVRELTIPLFLWVSGSLFLVFLGFLHGGGESAIVMSGTRFTGQLPSDNDIPHFFVEWFYHHGHKGTVPIYPPDWLSSDRPPLQVGYVLSQRNFGYDPIPGFNYELITVALQQLWIVGLWALLSAARAGRATRGLAMATVLVSDVAIVNGFFVWPKMLPAAMVLAAAALVLTPIWTEGRRDWKIAALVASLLGLAMLGHGSSIFAVIPLAIVAAFRGLPSWRWIGVAVTTGLLFMVPWSAYQKYHDPPGNRLTKWMIAGVTGVEGEFSESEGRGPTVEGSAALTPGFEDESALHTITDAYRRVGIGGALHNKAENFVEMVGGGPAVTGIGDAFSALEEGRFGIAVREVRAVLFYNLLPSLGLLLLAPLIMLWARAKPKRSPEEWRLALVMYFVFAVGAIAWGVLLFGNFPARTYIQSGTYVLPILGLTAGVVGLRSIFPRFANWYCGIAAALMFALYIPSLTPPPGSSYSAIAALFAAIGLAGFCFLALQPQYQRRALEGETAGTLATPAGAR